MTSAVLIVAHGSRSEHSNQHFIDLVALIRSMLTESVIVEHAFLEMADPNIGSGLDGLRRQGADSIMLLPYFLSPGRHVVKDIPEIVNSYLLEHAEIRVEIAPFFGSRVDTVSKAMQGLVEQSIKKAD